MADEEVHDSGRMTPLESMMWELERDPQLSAAFANLTLLDRPPDRGRFRSRMVGACRAVPRLRQRVVPAPARLAPPQWLDDPDFDLDRHLRWVDLGGRAGNRDLLDLVATLTGRPFDRDRPLWEFVVVEGLEDGRAAMVQRFHHTITDGEGGVRLSVQFLDLEREPPVEAPATPAESAHQPGPAAASAAASWPERTLGAIAHSARDSLGMIGRAVGGVSDAAIHPGELPRRGVELADMARSAVRQFKVDGRRSPLWTERSLDRWFGTTELDLDTVRRAAHALGVSINDVFVTGAAHAASVHHQRCGTPVEELRVSIPVSLRQDRRAGGNAFSPTQVLVPTGDMTPAERVRAVHEVMDQLKAERVLGSVEATASAVNLLPSAAIVRTGRRVAGSVDFVCSNVRAAPFDLFMGGALVEANYPIGPLAGTAFNLTTMSYRGTLFVGLIADTAAVREPGQLLADIEDAYRGILRAAGVRRRRQP